MSVHTSPNSHHKSNQQKVTIETKQTCEQCKRQRKPCNSQRPCSECTDNKQNCVYNVVSDQSRSVFSTQAARRLSSGSACETCRRRKTKCDGGSPCSFCSNNNIECVNHNLERRQQLLSKLNKTSNSEAIERIEDRLRRIEKLMTAFSPSPLSSSITPDGHKVRPHRHSVQGFNVAKEKPELNGQYDIKRRGSPYSSRYSSMSPPPQSNNLMKSSNSNTVLNISPPNSQKDYNNAFLPTPPNSARSTSSQHTDHNEWKIAGTIPSVTEQLSKITFATTANDYSTFTHYPIYPLSSSQITPPPSRPNSHS